MPAVGIIAAGAAVVGAGAAVVGTVQSAKFQKKSMRAQKEAAKFERQKNELQSMRQRVDAVRQARAAQATVRQAAENQGVSGSSVAQGGQASIISQMTGNLSFLDQYGFLSDQASQSLQKAANAQGNADMWSSIAGAGFALFGTSGGFDAIGGAFKGPPPPQG